ncbi:MAG: hypothetical protein LBR85_00480 [Oscillospiraceae bacterium]|jgi:hypothetical protein|nr:hypothetical protein [Oscillospiraceae bacterium]
MTVESPTRRYTVLARLCGNKRRLIARARGEEGLFLLVIADYPPLARKLTPVFMGFLENAAFTDFVEFFPYDGGSCAVFRHRAPPETRALCAVISKAPPRLRTRALTSLLAALLTQNTPFPILRDLLRPENLVCSESGEVSFIYDLYLTSQYIRHDSIKTMLYLSETVRSIYPDAYTGALYGLLTDLRAHGWDELYAAALRDAREIEALTPKPEREKPGLRARAEAFTEALKARAAPVLAAAALLAGFALAAVMFCRAVFAPPPPENAIKSIGTVILEDESVTP